MQTALEPLLLLYSYRVIFTLHICCAIAFDNTPTWTHLNKFGVEIFIVWILNQENHKIENTGSLEGQIQR